MFAFSLYIILAFISESKSFLEEGHQDKYLTRTCHLEVIPHDQRQLPDAGVGLGGAGRDHAVVENLKKTKWKNLKKKNT